jgi:adenylosuccinate lyase
VLINKVLAEKPFMDKIFENFSVEDGQRVKEIERTTNHDVKAIEYFLKEQFDKNPVLAQNKEFLHFSCTSEDINNLAYGLMLRHSFNDVILPQMRKLHEQLANLAIELADVPMLCRTHGQSATPSTMGKEIANFAYRLNNQIRHLEAVTPCGKFNGATGNLNAHLIAFADKEWIGISQRFVEGLGLKWNPYTT